MKKTAITIVTLIFGISFCIAQNIRQAAEAQKQREAQEQQAAEAQKKREQQAVQEKNKQQRPAVGGQNQTTVTYTGYPDVYLAGQIGDRAVLWKNGTAQYLSKGNNYSSANSVFVSGNDVYVAGRNDGKAVLWKNGVEQNLKNLPNYSDGANANSVFVSGNDVYVVGSGFMEEESAAILWKNSAPQHLADGIDSYAGAEANSVYVSGNNVYVAGIEYESTTEICGSSGKLWKNGIDQNITERTNISKDNSSSASIAHSVFVSGNDVYAAGYEEYIEYNEDSGSEGKSFVILWINGIGHNLTNGTNRAEANSVFVAGSDVYVAGNEDNASWNRVAKVWKNGVAQNLSDGKNHAHATSVFVSGSDVYVAGLDNGVVTLWKNGVTQKLTDGTVDAYVHSVFVVSNQATGGQSQREQQLVEEQQQQQQQQSADEQRQRDNNLRYQNAIESAQRNLNRQQYAEAKQDYLIALDLKPENAATINREIDKIDRKLNEPALLLIYRLRKFGTIIPVRYDILLDNTVVATSTTNWKTTVTVNSLGRKTISATIDGRKAEASLNFEPGGVYYLRSDVSSTTRNTGRTRTTTDRNGKTTTTDIKETLYTPVLQLIENSLGERESNSIK